MKKLKELFNKAYNMATWKHFVIWAIFVSSAFTISCSLYMQPEVPLSRIILGGTIFGIIFSYIPTYTIWIGKYSTKFYAELEEFNLKAQTAKTSEELLIIRQGLIEFNKRKQHDGQAVEKVFILIDSRLKYEFNFIL